jgi:hypothetical protein
VEHPHCATVLGVRFNMITHLGTEQNTYDERFWLV